LARVVAASARRERMRVVYIMLFDWREIVVILGYYNSTKVVGEYLIGSQRVAADFCGNF